MHALLSAFRSLTKSPGYSGVTIGILALGIGASAAIFSLVHALLLSPLAYGDARRLVQVQAQHKEQGTASLAPATFLDLAKANQSFESLAAQTYTYVNLTQSGPPALVTEVQGTPGYFQLFGVAPLLGRTWSPEEAKTGHAPIVVLGQRLWERQYGGRRELVGQAVMIENVPHVVIGVMPASFKEPWGNADLWRPMPEDGPDAKDRSSRFWSSFARLRPGVTLAQANAELATIAQRLELAYPEHYRGWTLRAEDLQRLVVGDYRRGLLLVLGAVGCIMLITCANLAGLSVVRAYGRRKELAVRVALGASRGVLARQLLGESLVLSVVGGILGLVVSSWLLAGLLASLPPGWLPRSSEVVLNTPVLLASLGLAVVTGVAFGLAPAFSASRVDPNEALKNQARGSGGPAGRKLRSGLVVTEIALALVLLASAGLLGKSFLGLLQKKSGIDAPQLLSLTLLPSSSRYDTPGKRRDYYARAAAEVAAVPGVQAVGFTQTSPFRWGNTITLVPVPRDGVIQPANVPQVFYDSVSADYFRAVGSTLRAGRYFNDSDEANAKNVIVLSEAAARRLFGAENPLGRELTPGATSQTRFEVVGIVADIRRTGLANEMPLQVYRPMAQRPAAFATLMVRTDLAPSSLAKPVQAALWRVDAETPISDVVPMDVVVNRSMAEPRLYLGLFSAFAGLAVALAGIGLYGLVAYGVAQRTREFGIRTALGADSRTLLGLVFREGFILVGLGLVLGLGGAMASARLLGGFVVETSTHDPLVFGLVPLVLAAVAMLACLIPARRAARVDPLVALRAE